MTGLRCMCDGRADVTCTESACSLTRPGPYTLDQCRVCWLRLYDPAYMPARASAATPGGVLARYRSPCRHLGPPTGEGRPCLGCGQSGKTAPVHSCPLHGLCVTGWQVAEGVQTCGRCPDFDPGPAPTSVPPARGPVTVRDLCYHAYPVRGSCWRRRVASLVRRLALFNGRRVVAVATDHTTESPHEVERAFGGQIDDLVTLQNDPSLREVATFHALLGRARSVHPGHALFYAHTKGVTRGGHRAVDAWCAVLHEAGLDYWPAVQGLLERFPVAGAFKKLGRGWPDHESARSLWHYSGSFYWLRSADVFSRAWQDIDRFWSGVEPWPSLHFSAEEAGCVFWEAPVPAMNLYDERYVLGTVLPAWRRWKEENAHLRTTWQS